MLLCFVFLIIHPSHLRTEVVEIRLVNRNTKIRSDNYLIHNMTGFD